MPTHAITVWTASTSTFSHFKLLCFYSSLIGSTIELIKWSHACRHFLPVNLGVTFERAGTVTQDELETGQDGFVASPYDKRFLITSGGDGFWVITFRIVAQAYNDTSHWITIVNNPNAMIVVLTRQYNQCCNLLSCEALSGVYRMCVAVGFNFHVGFVEYNHQSNTCSRRHTSPKPHMTSSASCRFQSQCHQLCSNQPVCRRTLHLWVHT